MIAIFIERGSVIQEIWKEVDGSDGKYKVSNFGKVWSNHSNKLLGLKPAKDGYHSVSVIYKNKRQSIGLHRLVAFHFVDGYIDGYEVNHLDANKSNNRADNLEWCTHKKNMKHVSDNELYPKNVNVCFVDKDNVIYKKFVSQMVCEAESGIRQSYIWACCYGKSDSIDGIKIRLYDKNNNDYIKTKYDEDGYDFICTRKQQIFCIETGQTFRSQCEAGKKLGVSQGEISNYLNGKKKNSVNGFTFKRVSS